MLRITLNKPAADALRAGVERLAEAANSLEHATKDIETAAATEAKVAKASARTYRLWGAVALSDLFKRLTGR